ncbi:MAG: hypothetical protein AAFX46_16785 [Cyanobacteria bacterium J06636_27]
MELLIVILPSVPDSVVFADIFALSKRRTSSALIEIFPAFPLPLLLTFA